MSPLVFMSHIVRHARHMFAILRQAGYGAANDALDICKTKPVWNSPILL
jgi:hypothetical protein